MPSRNSIKQYSENSYYHIYNRGVEKRHIFLDQQDYSVFLSYLKEYLLPKNESVLTEKLADPEIHYKEKDKILKLLRLNNFYEEINLLAYCLMPNHFHFLIKQKNAGTIDKFMNSLGTRYTMYFNRKYSRVGSLCQAVYKAVLVSTDEQLLHLSRYIHKQALPNQPCSYLEYLNKRNTAWIHPEEVLAFFTNSIPNLSYDESFVQKETDSSVMDNLTLED